MQLTGWAAERLAAMTPARAPRVVHVSLTDDHPWAQAFVVIEAAAARPRPRAARRCA
jgi:holo-[acyl-carrier protein] synthase